MSAAMQKAAAVLGAAEVFHVLADQFLQGPGGKLKFPETIQEVQAAPEGGHLKWIRLGNESGWPQFRAATSVDYPLEIIDQKNSVRWLKAGNDKFREHLRTVVERSHRIADAWNGLGDLPFVELATWSPPDLQWLRQPLDPDSSADQNWVARLPKVELHCHLGGFATRGPQLTQVRLAATWPTLQPPLSSQICRRAGRSPSAPSRWKPT